MILFLILIFLILTASAFLITRSALFQKEDRLLVIYFITAAVSILSKIAIYIHTNIAVVDWSISSTLVFVALSHLYIKEVVYQKQVTHIELLLSLFPFLISVVTFSLKYIDLMHNSTLYNQFVGQYFVHFGSWLRTFFILFYLGCDFYVLSKVNYFNNKPKYRNNNLLIIIFLVNKIFLLSIIINFALAFIDLPIGIISVGFFQIPVLSLLIIYYKIFLPFKEQLIAQQKLLKAETKINDQKTKYSKLEIPQEKLLQHQQTITKYLDENKPYLNPDFSFDDLVAQTQIPKNELSFVLNQVLHFNFYQLINQKRIEYFLEHINEIEVEGKTILSLAYDSGFNSKSTFNKYFKIVTQKSPSEYIKAVVT